MEAMGVEMDSILKNDMDISWPTTQEESHRHQMDLQGQIQVQQNFGQVQS